MAACGTGLPKGIDSPREFVSVDVHHPGVVKNVGLEEDIGGLAEWRPRAVKLEERGFISSGLWVAQEMCGGEVEGG